MSLRSSLSTLRLTTITLSVVALAACDDDPPAERDLGVAFDSMIVADAYASNPTVAITPDGAALVAWVGGHDSDDVWLARALPGVSEGGGEAHTRVNHIPGDAAAHAQAPAQVAVAPDGAVFVLWQNNTPIEGRRFPASDLRFARSTDGGRTFEPAIHVNDDAGGVPSSHTFHDLEVAADGTVYASWIDGRRELEAGPDIRVARSVDGGRSFGPSTVVATAACPCCRTSLAVAPDGTLFVAWRHVFEGSVRDIVIARSSDGGATFDAPVRVHADGWVYDGCPHAGPSVVVATDGTVHVAWYTGATDATGLHHAVSRDGGRTFEEPRALTGDGQVPVSQVALAAAGDGAVWAAWEAAGVGGPRVRLARIDGGVAHAIDDDAPPGMLPALAVRGDAVALTWLDGDAARALVSAAGAQ